LVLPYHVHSIFVGKIRNERALIVCAMYIEKTTCMGVSALVVIYKYVDIEDTNEEGSTDHPSEMKHGNERHGERCYIRRRHVAYLLSDIDCI